jgi:hypothetical protein
MKVNKKKQDSFYILGYILELMIFFLNGNLEKKKQKKSLKSGKFGPFFP